MIFLLIGVFLTALTTPKLIWVTFGNDSELTIPELLLWATGITFLTYGALSL